MTGDPGVICRRCGFSNEGGDQFCGSCGAFLEWEGEAAVDAGPGAVMAGAGAASPIVDEGIGGLVRPPAADPVPAPPPAAAWVPPAAPVWSPAAPDPTPTAPAWSPAASAAPVPPSAAPAWSSAATPGADQGAIPTPGGEALLRCPACGIANAPTRTFCQSCGARLADAARVAEVSRDRIAAAVAAPVRPGATPGSAGPSARPEPSGGPLRGIRGWVIGVAALGIVVGVGIVAAGALLKSPGPATGATADPLAIASTAPGTSVASALPPSPSAMPPTVGPSTAEPTPAPPTLEPATPEPPTPEPPTAQPPTPEPPTPEPPTPTPEPPTPAPPTPAPTPRVAGRELTLTGATASSVVGNLAKFQAARAIDGDPKTCWQEGSPTEVGQWIEVTFAPARVDAVVLSNGYGASTALFLGNHRLKEISISIDGGSPLTVTIKDTNRAQRIALGEVSGATRVRITIVSVYKAQKTSTPGTPFDDAALGEIRVIGAPGG